MNLRAPLARVGISLATVGLVATGFAAAPSASAAKAVKPQIVTIDAGPVRYEPRTVTVTVGQPVIFRITNSSTIDHEALLGSETEQNKHEKEMADMAAMGHDMAHMDHGPSGPAKAGEGFVKIPSKKTGEIKTTFTKVGRTIIGCHLPGHYKGGMRLTVIVKQKALGVA